MEVKIAEILSQLDTATNRTGGGGGGGGAAASVGGGDASDSAAGTDTAAQLEREQNASTNSQFLDVVKIMDLNRECRKRIAQIGEIKG